MPAALGLRRIAAVLAIAGYLGCTLYFQVKYWMGDVGGGPAAYFWTWDMFPGYSTGSHRRLAVGTTDADEFVQLDPSASQLFRLGVQGDKTRFDYLPSVSVEPVRGLWRQAIARNLQRHPLPTANRRVTRVLLFEQYWPPKFNLGDALYQRVYEQPHPHRRYWRVLEEAEVHADGTIAWSAAE